jgi:hypothetical protein
MKKISKFSKRTGYTLSLNADRGDATWQQERGERYGNSRKARAKSKVSVRKSDRRKNKLINLDE